MTMILLSIRILRASDMRFLPTNELTTKHAWTEARIDSDVDDHLMKQ
jgi:hypothetical protein